MNSHPYFAQRNAADHRDSLQSVAENTRLAKRPAPSKPGRLRRLAVGKARPWIRVRPAPTR
jgi:hypothetical protein